MSHYKVSLVTTLSLFATCLQAASSQEVQNSPYTPANANQAKVVIYRSVNGYFAVMTRAFIDINGNEPVAALWRNEHTVFCVRPGKHILGTHHEDAIIYSDKNRKEQDVLFKAGKTYIYKIQDEERVFHGQSNLVSLEKFQRETPSSSFLAPKVGLINNAIVVPCEQAVAPAIKDPVPVVATRKEISLGADALFVFDRSGMGDLLPEGKSQIDALVKDLRTYTVHRIDVLGYTDQLGSHAYNLRLSQARAETVKSYLVSKGVDGALIYTEGRGEQDPVVACPEKLSSSELQQCLLPNRRVTLRINATAQK